MAHQKASKKPYSQPLQKGENKDFPNANVKKLFIVMLQLVDFNIVQQ